MDYYLSIPIPSSRFLKIKAVKVVNQESSIEFQLPSWRPGRYELGNFAKNIRSIKAYDENGKALRLEKITKDKWQVLEINCKQVTIDYEYFASQPDAGACWVDEQMLYVNPIHCMIYESDNLHEKCNVYLDIPPTWEIACALKETKKHVLEVNDFHELVDSPFFASATLQHQTYSVNDHLFHIWFQGECKPDWNKIIKDFEGFTKVQLEMMHKLPNAEYHFLILILPFRFYHGVEHISSTVLALGPGYKLMEEEMYNDLLGVASHELFHAWNVKTLRPKDFIVYDYTKENYSQLGWVYEGFTTYYGDLFLARSGFFDTRNYFIEINSRLQKHFDNYGRFNLSVSDSSYDTWLDGYVPGAPARKTNIYDEGSLIALLLDLSIRRATADKKSLDDLFYQLYNDFAPQHLGYSEKDVRSLAIDLAGNNIAYVFDELLNQPVSYEVKLNEMLSYIGCYLSKTASVFSNESLFGFRIVVEGGVTRVSNVLPGSPAENAGLSREDELISCNGWKVENNLSDLIKANLQPIELNVFSQRKMKTIVLSTDSKTYFETVRIAFIPDANDQQKASFNSWCGLSFTI